jgi:hypothetical protein
MNSVTMSRYDGDPGCEGGCPLRNSTSSALRDTTAASLPTGPGRDAATAASGARDHIGTRDHRGTGVFLPHTGQTTLRPSHRASARSRFRQDVQRNFTSKSSTSGGNTGTQPAKRPDRLVNLGTGTLRAQLGHWTTSSEESEDVFIAVPQMTQ